ncbi:MAG TPA: FixH family protein [Polyangiaceae bacterium]
MNEHSAASSTRRSLWAWVPALLLGCMFLGLGTMTYLATSDPHFALEPDYYDKAVHWDRSRAEEQASALTGLSLSLSRPLALAPGGGVDVEVRVVDRQRSPFQGARLQLQAFPNAYAQHSQTLTLRETAPGVYAGRLSRGVLGLWELRFGLARDAVRFQKVLREDVVKGGAA